jgi:hypothetical protein
MSSPPWNRGRPPGKRLKLDEKMRKRLAEDLNRDLGLPSLKGPSLVRVLAGEATVCRTLGWGRKRI